MSQLPQIMSQHRRSLVELVDRMWTQEGRRPIAPLVGYPGLELSNSTIKQNQFNHTVQYQTLARLYRRLQPDVMFFLMDLSVEASALGLPVRFPLDETPSVEGFMVKNREDLQTYRNIDILGDGRVMVYLEVMRHMRVGLPVPVGAYVTGPFTLAGLMMDATDLAMKSVLEPQLCHEVLQFATSTVMRYAEALMAAGADTIMILDPTAVMLGPDQFDEFAAGYVREITGMLNDIEVILHICGDTTHILENMASTGAAGLSVDDPMDMAEVAEVVGPEMLLIGNVCPVCMLDQTPGKVAAVTRRLLDRTADHPRMILSSGCDIPQDVPMTNVEALMEIGRDWRRDRVSHDAVSTRS